MDSSKGRKSSSSSLPLWSRASTRLGIRRKSSSRPAISAPFGPVKNSRGPDFSRSDTLIIVDGIEDCAYSNLPSIKLEGSFMEVKKSKSSLTTATRRLSASFPLPPSAASPTVANSNITAATGIQAPLCKKPVKELRKASFTVPSRPAIHSGLRTSSTVSLLPYASQPPRLNENTPPGLNSLKSGNRLSQRVGGRLPTSKTVNVLQDIKDTVPPSSVKITPSLIYDKPKQIVSPAMTAPTTPYANLQNPQSSKTSFFSHSVESIYQDFDPQLVNEAQPSAYWSGRFMSLHDKYSSEVLSQRLPHRLVSTPERQTSYPPLPSSSSTRRNITEVPRVTYLPHATTTSALLELPQAAKPRLRPPPPPPPAARDEEAQCRRIFGRLEALCTTDEARRSLFQWQQSYARRNNRPNLLPEGGTMNGKSFVSKWFNSYGPRSGKRNLNVWREGDNNHHLVKESPRRHVEMHHFRATLT